MKYSKQREMILDAVKNNPIHPTADDVFAILRKTQPNISLGTVYRNLNLLSEVGYIRKIPVPNASDRFDGTIEQHHHMLCIHCGRAFDLQHDLVNHMAHEIFDQTGFRMNDCGLLVLGECKECRNKKTLSE